MDGWIGFNIFQNREFAEIYSRHRGLNLLDIQGSNAFIFKSPIIGNLKMRVYLHESSNINSLLEESLKLCKLKKIPMLEIITSHLETYLNNYPYEPLGTYAIDLTYDIDTLWRKLKQQNRTQIRYAQKNGVIVKKARTMDEFKEWWCVYEETVKRGRFMKQRYTLAEELFNNPFLSSLFIATVDGKIAAGLFILTYEAPFYWIGGSLPEYWHVKPNNLLHWEVIKWAHGYSYPYYDMGGAIPSSKHGVTRFKKQFGGEYKESYKYRIEINTINSKLINMIVRLQYKIRKRGLES